MPNYDNVTPVIFRKFSDGEIIALFPTLPADYYMGHVNSYMHIGQHGTADYHGVMAQTRPASDTEYADLLAELRGYSDGRVYDDLRVYRRQQPWMVDERRETIRQWIVQNNGD